MQPAGHIRFYTTLTDAIRGGDFSRKPTAGGAATRMPRQCLYGHFAGRVNRQTTQADDWLVTELSAASEAMWPTRSEAGDGYSSFANDDCISRGEHLALSGTDFTAIDPNAILGVEVGDYHLVVLDVAACVAPRHARVDRTRSASLP